MTYSVISNLYIITICTALVLLNQQNLHFPITCKFNDSIWCIVNLDTNMKLLVGVCYRSPSSSEENNRELAVFISISDIVKKQITVEMKDIFIRPDDVLEKMKKLKENKAPGIDTIYPKVLKR